MDKLQTLILKYGARASVSMLTLLCILAAIVLTYISLKIVWAKHPLYTAVANYALTTAVVVTGIIAPIIISIVVKLLFKVHALERQARLLASIDPLTGLMTRRAFYEIAEKQLKLAIRSQHPFAIIVVDLDAFKQINDTYGHQMGDQVLKKVGHVIDEATRASDSSGRVGGDEFIFCLSNETKASGLAFAKRLLDSVNTVECIFEGKKIKLTASMGLHVANVKAEDTLADLIHQADMALYKAKREGKATLR